jgi:hypothetical protein
MGTAHDLLQHGCMVFSDVDAFAAFGEEFLAEGADRGERTMYLDRDETITAYGDGSLDPHEQVEIWRGTLREALADGYTGLRVVADLTGIVPEDPKALATLARYEHLVDRFMATTDHITGRCGYDSTALDPSVLAALAALHAPDGGNPSQMHLLAVGDEHLRLAGEVDSLTAAESLPILVNAVIPEAGRTVRVDAADLAYIDHNSLLHLDAIFDAADSTLEIVSDRRLLHRMVDLVAPRRIACVAA